MLSLRQLARAYPIVPSGLTSPNYAFAFVPGTLTTARGAVVVTLSTSPEPSGFEGSMTFTASVSAEAPSAGMPTGAVHFYDESTLIGSASLDAGTAGLSTAGLDPGSRTIEARYEGDSSFEPATGAAPHTIRDASQTPSVTLSSSRTPSNVGQSVTFTATVSMPSGGVSGQVEFRADGELLGTRPISAGRATFTTSSLAVGSHAVTARYVGSGTVPPATSNVLVQAVGAAGWKNRTTSMTIVGAPNPATLGSTVTFTATVSGSSGTPTGRILFILDGVVVADVAIAPLSGSASRATLELQNLAHGRHSVSAPYLGNPTYRGSTGQGPRSPSGSKLCRSAVRRLRATDANATTCQAEALGGARSLSASQVSAGLRGATGQRIVAAGHVSWPVSCRQPRRETCT